MNEQNHVEPVIEDIDRFKGALKLLAYWEPKNEHRQTVSSLELAKTVHVRAHALVSYCQPTLENYAALQRILQERFPGCDAAQLHCTRVTDSGWCRGATLATYDVDLTVAAYIENYESQLGRLPGWYDTVLKPNPKSDHRPIGYPEYSWP